MGDLYIDVKVYGGSSIPLAIPQMVDLANRLGISVWADLNGVRTLARPGDDPAEILASWEQARVVNGAYPTASAKKRAKATGGTERDDVANLVWWLRLKATTWPDDYDTGITLRKIATTLERLQTEREHFAAALEAAERERDERCEHCGATVSSYPQGCPLCGAPQCCQPCCKITALSARVAELESWNRQMVEKAAAGGVLDGYRELGQRAASAEARAEAAEAKLAEAREVVMPFAELYDAAVVLRGEKNVNLEGAGGRVSPSCNIMGALRRARTWLSQHRGGDE